MGVWIIVTLSNRSEKFMVYKLKVFSNQKDFERAEADWDNNKCIDGAE